MVFMLGIIVGVCIINSLLSIKTENWTGLFGWLSAICGWITVATLII